MRGISQLKTALRPPRSSLNRTSVPGDTATQLTSHWLDFPSGEALVFLRTAFAHLYVWHEGNVYSLDVHRGGVSEVTNDVELFFSLLVDEDIQKKILRLGLYQEVKEKLGRPARDECCAFVPALAVGGSEDLDHVQRVKLREHLALLAQLAQE